MWLQNLNILMIGAQNGKGGFFPKGIQGKINKPVGFDKLAEATEDWTGLREAEQVSVPAYSAANSHILAVKSKNPVRISSPGHAPPPYI